MYKQIDVGKNDLLVHFLTSMITNKVTSKPQTSLIATSINYVFRLLWTLT